MQDLINIVGSMSIFFLVLGNSSTVLPFIVTERTVLYRERFAGMYSYPSAQVTVEIPYISLQALLFVTITYPAINFYWSAYKMIWYSYTLFSTLLYFNYLGMMFISLTPTFQVASVLAGFSYTMLNLFAGFIIPEPKIPKWWVWGYWICPTAWSLKALITSQYGDINKEISVFGEPNAINAFFKSYYGYNHDDLGVIAIVLISFPLVFASVFGYTIAKLNFQRK
ncbi:Pleiotropic drug resistance protein 3 [Vitis vinifera]|uniref:Pleiotropic drug resistance protein 3 n=1 Tax=Vitis vinifera TaxID=29760 RepID=A0A438E1K7_VITVI|nr:Pleiotropic drug resistance protein 3 [Vitis vinifera]